MVRKSSTLALHISRQGLKAQEQAEMKASSLLQTFHISPERDWLETYHEDFETLSAFVSIT